MTQPDLFGRYDALLVEPATCSRCGTTERSGWMLENNHGTSTSDGMCMAQRLVTFHIRRAVETGNADALARDMARGRELNLPVEYIVREASA